MSVLIHGWLPVQAVEARTTEVCGVDMSAINRYRWTPAFAAGMLSTDVLACISWGHVMACWGLCSDPEAMRREQIRVTDL